MALIIFFEFLLLHAMEQKEKEIFYAMEGKDIMVPENGGVYLFYNQYEGWQISDQLPSDVVTTEKPLILNLFSPNLVKEKGDETAEHDKYKIEGNHYYQVLRTAKLEQLSNNQTILNLDISPILLDLNELSLSVLQQQKEKIEEQAELIRSLCESNNTANQNEPSSDVENSVSAFFNRNSALLTCGAAGVGFGLLIGLVTWSNSSGNS